MLVKKFRKSIFFSKVDRFIMRILEKTLNRKGYRLWRQCALSGYINLYNPSFVEFFTAALKTLTLQSKYLHHKQSQRKQRNFHQKRSKMK